ncbi:hypothetical protein [Dyadobacter sp. 676]|uniref:histidine kinase n=1 Tax=Dyadobacter sp. 676 TaxID=3088362 RepID=A0AAU8FMY2_9BACT
MSPFGLFRLGTNLYHDDQHGNIELIATTPETNVKPGKIKLTRASPQHAGIDLSKPYVIYSHDLSGQTFIYQNQKLHQLSQGKPGALRTTVLLESFDFQKNNIVSVYFDEKHQRLYLGTSNNGFFILDFHFFETLTVDSNEPDANVFYSQIAFSDSTILIPSFNVLGKDVTGRTISYKLPPLVHHIPMNMQSVLKSRSGDIWVRKMNMLYQFDGKSKKLKNQWNAGREISPIYEGRDGRIWLGTRFDGLLYINPEENEASLRTFSHKITGITYMLQENTDTLWVGTRTGLFRVDLKRKTFSVLPNTSTCHIKSLHSSQAGELWITTGKNGLFLLKDAQLTRLPLDKNKILLNAHCLMEDRNGFLWIPTNNGLFRIYRKDLLDFTEHRDSTRLYYHRFKKRDGFRTNEFNGGCQPCAVRLRNGYLSLPSIDGLVFFRPEQTPVDVPDSQIFIDRIEADSRNIPVNGSKIQLNGVSDIQVFISSPYLGNWENQQLFYSVSSDRRTEIRQIWHPIENEQQSVHLNSLESGTYTLKIRKNGGFGANSERLATLTLVIPYAWYETWPFKMLVVSLLLTAIFMYYKNRLRRANRLNRILESRVSEKTRNLQETINVLKTSEQELMRQTRLQMHLIASISHDIRSPLRSIEFTSAKLSGIIENGDYTLAKTLGSRVNESSRKILSLLENMLSYAKSHVSGDVVSYEIFPARPADWRGRVHFHGSIRGPAESF